MGTVLLLQLLQTVTSCYVILPFLEQVFGIFYIKRRSGGTEETGGAEGTGVSASFCEAETPVPFALLLLLLFCFFA